MTIQEIQSKYKMSYIQAKPVYDLIQKNEQLKELLLKVDNALFSISGEVSKKHFKVLSDINAKISKISKI